MVMQTFSGFVPADSLSSCLPVVDILNRLALAADPAPLLALKVASSKILPNHIKQNRRGIFDRDCYRAPKIVVA